MTAMTTEYMLRFLTVEPGRCPICEWPYSASMCKPGDCSCRPDGRAEQDVLRQNRETYRRVEPLLKAAARNVIVAAHLAAIRTGDHPDPTAALVRMVADLVEINERAAGEARRLVAGMTGPAYAAVGPLTPEQRAEMKRLLAEPLPTFTATTHEPPPIDMTHLGGSLSRCGDFCRGVIAGRQLAALRDIAATTAQLPTLAADLNQVARGAGAHTSPAADAPAVAEARTDGPTA